MPAPLCQGNPNRPSQGIADVLQEIERGLRRAGFDSGGALVVACSGGPDSTALALALHERGHDEARIMAAHFNHRTRGEESDGDEGYVRDLCAKLDVPLTVGAAPKATDHMSENDARRMRYTFLERVARDIGARFVAVAHTADDQAETILLRIARGTGVRGLAGMDANRPISEGSGVQLIRPMLGLHRSDVEEYLRSIGVTAREDSSNADLRYARNRVRHTIMPALKQLNPAAVDAITRLAADARQHRELVAAHPAEPMPHDNEIDSGMLVRLPQPVAAFMLERMHSRAMPERDSDAQLERHHIEEALRLASRREPSEMHLPGGVTLRNRYGKTSIVRTDDGGQSAAHIRGELRLAIPGRVELPDGSSITAEVVAPPESFTEVVDGGNTSAWLSSALMHEDGLMVRGRLPGDRYTPLGSEYAVKVQDLFVDAKVPAERRDSVPIVVMPSDGRIAWIAGFAPAEWAKVNDGDASCVKLSWRDAV